MNAERRAAAIEAGAKALRMFDRGPEFAPQYDDMAPADQKAWRKMAAAAIDAAAPFLVVHIHHHDIEKQAEHFNEGYEAAMAQHLADDPGAADEWLAAHDARVQAQALREARRAWPTILHDMVSRGHVAEWLDDRADRIEGES